MRSLPTAHNPQLVIRRAVTEEVLLVRSELLRPGLPLEEARFAGDDDPSTRHWVAECQGRVLGVVSVMAALMPDPPEGVGAAWQLRGMAVVPERRSTGLGSELLRVVHEEVAEPMWCNARIRAVPFYARNGWIVVSPCFDIPGVGPHHRMWWKGST